MKNTCQSEIDNVCFKLVSLELKRFTAWRVFNEVWGQEQTGTELVDGQSSRTLQSDALWVDERVSNIVA